MAIELAFDNGDGEVVIGPFEFVLADDCTIYEPLLGQSADHTLAEWAYAEGSEDGWEIQRPDLQGVLYPLVQIRAVLDA